MGIITTQVDTASLRKAYAETLIEIAVRRREIVVLDADLALSTQTYRFKQLFPERFFDMGVSEADMIDTGVGLALSGKIVFVSSFAMFATAKPWEQIRNSAAYAEVALKIVASHSGISVGEDGASHQAIEDLGLMRLIPNITVFIPADANAVKKIIHLAVETPGVVYVRLTRPSLPLFYTEDTEFDNKGFVLLRNFEKPDAVIVATGSMVYPSLKASLELEKKGVKIGVVDVYRLKPYPFRPLLPIFQGIKFIVTVEEHNIIGGLGESLSSFITEVEPHIVKKIALPDAFGVSGNYEALYDFYGLTTEKIISRIEEWLKSI